MTATSVTKVTNIFAISNIFSGYLTFLNTETNKLNLRPDKVGLGLKFRSALTIKCNPMQKVYNNILQRHDTRPCKVNNSRVIIRGNVSYEEGLPTVMEILTVGSSLGQDVGKVNVLIDWTIISGRLLCNYIPGISSSSFIFYILNCRFHRILDTQLGPR